MVVFTARINVDERKDAVAAEAQMRMNGSDIQRHDERLTGASHRCTSP